MDLDYKTNYSALYDVAPKLKDATLQRTKLDEAGKESVISDINVSINLANETLKLLNNSYELHSDRHIGDAIVTITATIKSINLFRNSLQ
jgi:hypothetical protein